MAQIEFELIVKNCPLDFHFLGSIRKQWTQKRDHFFEKEKKKQLTFMDNLKDYEDCVLIVCEFWEIFWELFAKLHSLPKSVWTKSSAAVAILLSRSFLCQILPNKGAQLEIFNFWGLFFVLLICHFFFV